MSSKLIVALDYANENEVIKLVDKLDPGLCALKVGSELFTSFGPEFVRKLVAKQFKIFLDLKFYDIPNTVAKACKAAADLGVWMLNIHTSGGLAMMEAARNAIDSESGARPLLIGVTILTSFREEDLSLTGFQLPLEKQVQRLALLARNAGLDGVVSSAHETQEIKALCGNDFLVVTPGIRPENSSNNDQNRVMTPKLAIKAGSDYLVVGRPITEAEDPVLVVKSICESINSP